MAKKPKSLDDVRDKLFPRSPIEVHHEDGEYHIYVEGEWYTNVKSQLEAALQVVNLIKIQGDDWYYPSTRVNPTWHGWGKISRIDLLEFTARESRV